MLGQALAQTFYRAGCKVVLVGPSESELERIRSHLFALRPLDVPVYQPECVALDLSEISYDVVQEKAASILEQSGQVDYLIHNSTICTRADILSSALDTDVRVMNVNYFGPVALTKGKRWQAANDRAKIPYEMKSFRCAYGPCLAPHNCRNNCHLFKYSVRLLLLCTIMLMSHARPGSTLSV